MKYPKLCTALLFVSGPMVGTGWAQVDTPDRGAAEPFEPFQAKRYGVEHYSKVWSKSPFDFEIRVEEEEVEEENPFENLKLAGLVQRGNEYFVSIYDEKGDKGERIRLRSGDEGNEEGFTIVRVERGENFRATKVHVQKGNDVGIIEYDTKKIEAKATGAVGGARSTGNQGSRSTGNAQRGSQNTGQQGSNGQENRSQKSAQEARNEVIKRLLEKAKQNQGGGQNSNTSAQGKGEPEKKRRVVLPPPK